MKKSQTEEQLQESASGRRAFLAQVGIVGAGSALLASCGGGGGGLASAAGGAISDAQIARAFQQIREDENQHVTFLVTALGNSARPRPTFDTTQAVWNPKNRAEFYQLAVALENTGTGAYLNAAPVLVGVPDILISAASIALVEGRHAGFLNALTNRPLLTDPTPGQNDNSAPTGRTFATLPAAGGRNFAQEVPQTVQTVLARANPFLVNANLNGGPPLTYSNSPSTANVTAVLNFALALEYLERDWYNRNVPKFFS